MSDVRHAHSVDLVAKPLAMTTRERVDQAFACIEDCAADDWEHASAAQARALADALGLVWEFEDWHQARQLFELRVAPLVPAG